VPLTKRAAERVLDRGRISDTEAKAAHLLPTQIATPEAFTEREATLIDKNQRLPNGTPLNRTPTWSDSPWSEPGNIQHGWKLIKARYADQPEVLATFERWAEQTEMPETGTTAAQWLAGDSLTRAAHFPRRRAPSAAEVAAAVDKMRRHDAATLSDKVRSVRGAPDSGPVSAAALTAALDDVAAVLPPDLVNSMEGIRVEVRDDLPGGISASFGHGSMKVNAALQNRPELVVPTIAHETMHWLWPRLPAAKRRRLMAHFRSRTRLDRESGNIITRRGVRYLPDDFYEELAGREDGTELLPYYFELLFQPPEALAEYMAVPQHRETLNLIAEVLELRL